MIAYNFNAHWWSKMFFFVNLCVTGVLVLNDLPSFYDKSQSNVRIQNFDEQECEKRFFLIYLSQYRQNEGSAALENFCDWNISLELCKLFLVRVLHFFS